MLTMSTISLTESSNEAVPGSPVPPGQVTAVREFNRFYTNVIGLLREGLHDTPYSLTEARVIFELARQDETDTTRLRHAIDIDAGYLSRILARFAADGLVAKTRSRQDARRQVITLTGAGREVSGHLDELSSQQIRDLLASLPAGQREQLTSAMAAIRQILHEPRRPATVVLRPPAAGDLGWVVQRNAVLYAAEYGFDASYEALVARIVADYAAGAGPREAGWIAELDGERAGCVFCMRDDDQTARLRLLLVEPQARGLGIGGRLVAECVSFARQAGYREMVLWTNDVLTAARRIYQRAGFGLVSSNPHHSFGQDLVGQDWRLTL